MKLVTILAVVLGLAAIAPASARDLADIKASGTIKIATEGQTPPFNYFKDGKLAGFDVDLGNALAQKLGVKAEWVTLPFDSLLIGLGEGRYDFVIAGHGITPEREKAVDFSTPYYCSGAVIVSLPGGAQKAPELQGKTVGVMVGTTYLAAVSKVENVGEIKTFPSDLDALQNLLTHHTDVWVSDKLTVIDIANKTPEAHLQIGDMLFTEREGIAFGKGNAALRDAVNAALATMLSDGSYAAISNRYLHRDIRCE
jgi:polar amino acid transport system substrate-binding protein